MGITITCIIKNAPLGVGFFYFHFCSRERVHFSDLYLNMAGNYIYTGETKRKRDPTLSASHSGNSESDLAAC